MDVYDIEHTASELPERRNRMRVRDRLSFDCCCGTSSNASGFREHNNLPALVFEDRDSAPLRSLHRTAPVADCLPK